MSFIVSNTYDIHATASLDLQFASKKSLVDQISGTNLVTHTRASNATYVDENGIIKDAVTNLVLRSEEFDNATWLTGNISVNENSIEAPDGTISADTITLDSTAHFSRQVVTVSESTNYTFSFYAKRGTATDLKYSIYNNSSNANIIAQTSYYSDTSSDSWARISVPFTTPAGCTSIGVYPLRDSGVTGTVYLWGAQLEQSSTVGEYVKTTSTKNSAPRFDHKVTRTTTNLILYSEEFDNAAWTALQGSQYLTTNQETAPNGTTTADKLTGSGSSAGQGLTQNTSSIATVCTFSVYAKYGTHQWIQLFMNGDSRPWANYDLINGVVGSATGTDMSASIIYAGNGWYRCSLTRTVDNGSNTGGRIYLVDSGTVSRNAFSATSDYVYLWGAQLEQNSDAGPYVKTTGSTATKISTESLGLLVEESRTNLLPYSEDFSTGWTIENAGISTNQTTAPDGTTTADKLICGTGTPTFQGVLQTITATDALGKFSVYAKAAELSQVELRTFSPTNLAIFDLNDGTVVSETAVGISTIVDAGNGWYRCSVTSSSGITNARISLADGDSRTFTPVTDAGIYIWGAQLEEGSFPTSYIRTSGSADDREPDITSIIGTNFSSWYNQTEGTVFAESTVQEFTSTVFPRIASLDRGDGSANFIALVRSSGVYKHEYSVFATTGQAVGLQPNTVFTPKSAARSACVYKTNDFIAAVNGILSTADTSGSVPTSISALGIGMQGNGTLPYNGTISRLTYWPKRLPNATLQSITT